MSDKTETEKLVMALSILSQVLSHRGHRGDADVLAKASLRLHDQAEEIERLKAEIAAMRSEVDAIANNLGEISGMIGNQFVVDTICQEIDRLFAITADAASPGEAPRAKSPTYDALLIIAQSVVGALHRAGLDDCDDPGEAIDVVRRSAYDDGWRTAANWMDRAELHDDIGSPAYIADRDVALGRSLLSVR